MNIVHPGEIAQPAHGWLVIEQNTCRYSRLSICSAQLRNKNGLSGSSSKVSYAFLPVTGSDNIFFKTCTFQYVNEEFYQRSILMR